MLFFVNNLFVAQRCESLRVPVDHAYTTVNQSFVVQVDKDFEYAFAALFVHSESRTVPVARCAQFTKLLQDNAPMFVGPFPSMFQELFAGEVGLFNTLLRQSVYYFGFGSNRGMVGSRHPASVFAFHAGAAYQNILDGIVKHVSHVEHTRDVRRRNDDGIRFSSVGF